MSHLFYILRAREGDGGEIPASPIRMTMRKPCSYTPIILVFLVVHAIIIFRVCLCLKVLFLE